MNSTLLQTVSNFDFGLTWTFIVFLGSDKTGEDNSVIFNDIIKMDDPQHRESIVSITDSACNYLLKTFNSRLDEMELSHIDSSESPSEEASPPNPSLSPPPPTDIPPKIPPSPRYIHKSFTENFLGVPNVSGITRSVTNVPGEGLLKVSFSDTDHLSCNNGEKYILGRTIPNEEVNYS